MNTNKKMWQSINRKGFLKKMKLLLPYFIKFKEDNKSLAKKYTSNCAVKRQDK